MEVTLLGPVSMRVDGAEIGLGGPKQRAVFALLALNAGHVVSLDRLIDALWSDEPPSRATLSLQSYVSRLRRTFTSVRTPRNGVPEIRSQPPGWVLTLDPQSLDVVHFESLVAQARTLLESGRPDDAAAAADVLQRGLGLWSGEALADLRAVSFAEVEAARLESLRLSALESLLEAKLLIGRADDVADEARRFVSGNPFRERGWGALALYRTGRQSEAVAAAAQLRQTLADELGLDPSPELRELEGRILRQDPSLITPGSARARTPGAVPAPAPTEPAALGDVYRVFRDAGDDGQSPADPVVGRDDILAGLDVVVADALAGRGRMVVFDAPAGLGKSTMLDALAQRFAARGGLVLRARGIGTGAMPALWPWVTIVRELTTARPELTVPAALDRAGGPLMQPGGDASFHGAPLSRTTLYRSVVDLLGTAVRSGPIAVLIDDVHGVDGDTLTLLSLAVEELAPCGLLFAVALRSDEPGTAAARTTAGRIRRDLARRFELRPLTAPEVAILLGGLSGAPAASEVSSAIHNRSAGNPLFATELIRLLTSERRLDPDGVYAALPSEVLEVLQQRLDRLPEQTLALLSVIALAGGPADVDLLAEVTGVDADAVLDGCESALLAGLLLDDDAGGFTLSHDLVRQTLDRGLLAARRIRLHAKIGGVLLKRGPHTPQQIVDVAQHLSLASPVVGPAAAVPYLIAASEDAISRFAHEQSEQYLLRALELAGQISEPDERAIAEGQVRGRLALIRAWSLGRVSLDARPAGGASLRPLPLDSELAASWLGTVVMTSVAGDYAWAIVAADEALTSGLPPAGQVAAHFARGWARYCLGSIDDAAHELSAVESLLATHQGTEVAGVYSSTVPAYAAAYQAVIAQVREDEPGADRWLAATMERCEISKTPGTDAELAYGWVMAMRGDAATALEHMRVCIDLADRHEYRLIRLQAQVMAGWAQVMLGDRDAMRLTLEAYDEYISTGMRNQTPFFLLLLAEAHAALGEPAHARQRLQESAAATAATGEVCSSPRLIALAASIKAAAKPEGHPAEQP